MLLSVVDCPLSSFAFRRLLPAAVTDAPLSINFLQYKPGVRLRIPLKFINADQSVDIKRGCMLIRVNRFIECVCMEEVPGHIVVDCSDAKQDQVIRLKDIKLPSGLVPARRVDGEYVLGIITSGKG